MTKTKALLVVLVFLAASAGFADVRVFQITDSVQRDQEANTRALCSFKGDLQRRVDQGAEILRTHPNGILGIPAATIRVSLVNQQASLKSLSPLVC